MEGKNIEVEIVKASINDGVASNKACIKYKICKLTKNRLTDG